MLWYSNEDPVSAMFPGPSEAGLWTQEWSWESNQKIGATTKALDLLGPAAFSDMIHCWYVCCQLIINFTWNNKPVFYSLICSQNTHWPSFQWLFVTKTSHNIQLYITLKLCGFTCLTILINISRNRGIVGHALLRYLTTILKKIFNHETYFLQYSWNNFFPSS